MPKRCSVCFHFSVCRLYQALYKPLEENEKFLENRYLYREQLAEQCKYFYPYLLDDKVLIKKSNLKLIIKNLDYLVQHLERITEEKDLPLYDLTFRVEEIRGYLKEEKKNDV